MPCTALHRAPDHESDAGPLSTGPDRSPHSAPAVPVHVQAEWHLAEVASAFQVASVPIDAELLRIVLYGLADLCGQVHERGRENPAQPPVLFRDNRIVAEALAMWEARVRAVMTDERHHAAEERE